MLTTAKTIQGFKLRGIDGDVGKVKEFFFDDNFWTVRYLIVDTGGWLRERQVLISPYFLGGVDFDSKVINVSLNKLDIETSPPLESDQPISRQFEESYAGHYGAPLYWTGPYVWGSYPYVTSDREKWNTPPAHQEKPWDAHLRSTKDTIRYTIQAKDDEIGQVTDFIVDIETWEIRYIVVDTNKWLPGKKVLIAPRWIDEIGLINEKVFVSLSRESVEKAPEYREDEVITRDYESRLYQYYDKEGYWTNEPVADDYRRHTSL